MGRASVDAATVVVDKKKVGIYDYSFFEHKFISVSFQGWNVVYYSIRHEL